jgi:sterol desaturase/sphingolipid hydroxylase (fatty acid hydroxylase superfamily)
MTPRKIPNWVSVPLIASAFGALLWLERRRPLRPSVEPKLKRNVRNLAVAGLAAVALHFAERPVVAPLARAVERRGWGILKRRRLPLWLEVAAAVVLLDYTLYVWHVLTHRAPLLWRFHVVHHADLDLDASTALRFHFGELVSAVAWRAGQIVVIGVSPLSLSVWQTFLFLSILFHHSNVELPFELERRLSRLIVTPRMHGIHHSVVREETDSNWSSGLTVWDRLHGTLRLNVPQQEIYIGVPAYRTSAEVGLTKILWLPFARMRPPGQLPFGMRPSSSKVHAGPPTRLLP